MAKKAFKAESKRLLDMMINSIYTHKEIFLRELISNASDALDKLYFKSLTENLGIERKDLGIDLAVDKENRLITITDNGIGMTKDELENNLGVIANSGSFKFKNDNTDTEKDDINVIGQFGVGFYSAFMVASEVTVESKAYGSEQAYKWYSQGVDGYTITDCDKEDVGTKITLKIKENTEEEEYDEYLQDYKLRMIVKKYSDYIRYPIRMEVSHQHLKEGTENEYETHTEIETLNSMVPIWNKSKSELKDEDYNQFYKEKFFDYDDPIAHIHTKTEGTATYNALMYIPSKAPFDYYSKDYEKGLQLYSNGVLIMDKCPDLLPDYFSFVKGLVDSADLSLNISREMLQHDRQLKIIEKSLERSIKNELTKMLRNDRERYEKFWKVFGLQIKFGVYNGFGAGKELLKDLLLFYSSYEKKLVTLEEYVSRMKEDQKYIYFASGETVDKIDKLPQTEGLRESGTEILYFTEEVDEFCAQILHAYQDKEFRSVLDQEIAEGDEKKAQEAADAHKAAFDFVKETLGDKVKEVRASARLKSHPVCLTAGEGLSFEMEKYFQAVQPDSGIHADRILELNVEHPAFAALEAAVTADPEKAKQYAQLLYSQALLIAGLPLEDPAGYTDLVCGLMK